MRTIPCNCYAGRSSSSLRWENWKKPLTFLAVLLALSFALSQLFGRFVPSDSTSNVKAEMRGLHAKINEIHEHLDNLENLQVEMGRKLKDQCLGNDTKRDKKSEMQCREDLKKAKSCSTLIEEKVQQAIATYDADDIGLADFALESAGVYCCCDGEPVLPFKSGLTKKLFSYPTKSNALILEKFRSVPLRALRGGAVISTPDTESYTVGIQPATLFGIPLCYPKNTPGEMIRASSLPGECWAFKGGSGAAVIRLLGTVNITSVSLEHIPLDISPTGHTRTAPREFSLWGISCQKDDERVLLGNFVYDNSRKPVQNFPVQFQSSEPFDHVLVKFHSNYGHPNYTCIYRIRIHGKLKKTDYGLR